MTRPRFPDAQSRRLSRRAALKTGAGLAAGATFARDGLAAAAQEATPAPGTITIPEPVTQLPTEDVTFRWIDSGDLKALFFTQYFDAYQQAHPNITIQYDALPWTEIAQIVPLGVQNGDAHDVFQIPLDIPSAQAVQEGWVAPLDDIIPNFEEWKARFPFGSFVEGVHVFNGQTYTFPITSDRRYGTLLLYNVEYMQAAGYDPMSTPLTLDQFRDAARKITEAGQGQYYGYVIAGQQTGRFAEIVRNLARMAGAPAGGSLGFTDIDWRTGEFVYTSDQYIAAIDLLLALQADGSILPGATSFNAPQARAQLPQGTAGMILQGPWNIPQWRRENPDFAFGVASQPVPNAGTPIPLTYEETGANITWVYAESPYKAIAADMFSYMSSIEGQVALMAATGGNLTSVFPEAVEIALDTLDLDPLASQALSLFEDQLRVGPQVPIRNPEAVQVAFERRAITPDFGETVQGIFSGQLSDPRAAMQDLQDRTEAELESAIEAARANGANVSRDDWVFPNWEPTEDYTQEDYAELGA